MQHLRSLLRLPPNFAQEPQRAKEIEMNARSVRILREKEGFSDTRGSMCRQRDRACLLVPPPTPPPFLVS